MRWEKAILQAIEELKGIPGFERAYLALLLRAGELTTDTSKCGKCGGGG